MCIEQYCKADITGHCSFECPNCKYNFTYPDFRKLWNEVEQQCNSKSK